MIANCWDDRGLTRGKVGKNSRETSFLINGRGVIFWDRSSIVAEGVISFRFFKAEARPGAIGRRPQKRRGTVWAQNNSGPN